MKLFIVFLLFIMSLSVFAFDVQTNSYGNMYYPNEKIQIKVDTDSLINYKITNYFGDKIKEGQFKKNVLFNLSDPCWYLVTLSDENTTKEIYISVILNKLKKSNGKICTDAAAAWLVSEADLDKFVDIIARSDIGSVRERFDWRAYQPNKETFDTKIYDRTFNAYKKRNVDVYQINHFTPDWTLINKDRCGVKDLRDVYNYHKLMAKTYPQIIAWEVWNEPDNFSWSDHSDKLSGYLKAAYLGLKAGNPNTLGAGVSMSIGGEKKVNRDIFESGYMDYTDILNWHCYGNPQEYPGILKTYLSIIEGFGYKAKPSWMTEAGIILSGDQSDDNNLNNENMRLQCEFTSISAIMSISAGNEKNYFFVAPPYFENNKNQFGLMRKDFNLYPGFASLNAAAHFISNGEYLGRYIDSNVECRIFRVDGHLVAVIWGDGEIVLPVSNSSVSVYDIFGKETKYNTDSKLRLKSSRNIQYVLNIDENITSKLKDKSVNRAKLVKSKPHNTIVMGYLNKEISKGIDAYILDEKNFIYTVEVYNFSDKKETVGNINVELPLGWVASEKTKIKNIKIASMGRKVFTFHISSKEDSCEINKIKLTGYFDAKNVAPCVTTFKLSSSLLTEKRVKILNFKDILKLSAAGGAVLSVNQVEGEKDTYLFDVEYDDLVSDRWAYPYFDVDMNKVKNYDAFVADVEFIEGSSKTNVAALISSKGDLYMGKLYNGSKNGSYIYLFNEITQSVGNAGKNFNFDAKKIDRISFGINTTDKHVRFKIRNPRLVKF